ncbi:MAG: diguanylate cyclase [Deltaproteobacteria bacterium]|nr:diguanylate cyclase [Deltaproteobacteria bacterium]
MKISINKKIMGLFSAGVILFILFAAGSFFGIKTLNAMLREANVAARKVNLTGDLQLQVSRLQHPIDNYLIEGDIKERDRFDGIVNEMSGLFAELKAIDMDKAWQDIAKKTEGDVIAFGEKAIAILYIDNPVGNKEAYKLSEEMSFMGDSLIQEADGFHRIAEDELAGMEARVGVLTGKIILYAAIAFVALLFSAGLLYYYLRKYVTKPINELYEGAGIIAKGNLQHRLTINTGDELEGLASAFNNMSSSLEEARKELDRRIFELYTLYNISKVLSTTFETEELLKEIVKRVSSNLGIEDVVIMLLDDKAQELYMASGAGCLSEEICKYATAARYKVGAGIYGWAAMSGEARLIKEVKQEKDVIPEEILSPDIQSIIIVPFGARGKILGLLCAYKNRPDVFGREDLELLKAVSEHVALALENARLYKETKMMAITDGLTGLYNHRYFVARLKEEIKRAGRYDRPLSLIIMDIDYFKQYNDTHGHQAGDEILRKVADIITQEVRNSDIAARYGGEEFVVISSETGKGQAVQMAERIRKVIEDYQFPHEETQPGGRLTISLGAAAFKADAANADELIKKADDALYRAKESGRNRVAAA